MIGVEIISTLAKGIGTGGRVLCGPGEYRILGGCQS